MAVNLIPVLLLLVVLASREATSFQQQASAGSKSLEGIQDDASQRHPAPEPYSFAYSSESIGGSSTHQESGDGSGRVTGFYTIQEADGRERRVDYVADENGYRANVRTNEVGTRAEAAADAQYTVQLPSAKQLEAAKISYEEYKYLEEQHQAERERNQQARSRHLSLKQQAQQQVIRHNQLASSGQQQATYAGGFTSDSRQVGSSIGGPQVAPIQSGSNFATSTGASSSAVSSSSSVNLNSAGDQSSGSSSIEVASPIRTGGPSREEANENYLYENSWRQGAETNGPSVNSTRFYQTAAGISYDGNRQVTGSVPSVQTLTNPIFSGYTATNQAGSTNYNQGGRKSGNSVAINEQTSGIREQAVPVAQPVQQQQQQQQEPIWKTLARLGGTTKRPITVLQRQLEQQFMQVANQLTDQDYPRQVQTIVPTSQQQVRFEPISETPQPARAAEAPVRPIDEPQQRFEPSISGDRLIVGSGYSNVNQNFEQRNATTSERPQIPRGLVWKGTSLNEAPYQQPLLNNQINVVSGEQQSAVALDLDQQNRQQNNILNEDTQLEDGKPDQVAVQDDRAQVQNFLPNLQQRPVPNIAKTSSENAAISTNSNAPNGFVSINLSETDAGREELTERPQVSSVTFAPESTKPANQWEQQARQEVKFEQVQPVQKQEIREEVSVVSEPNLQQQQQVISTTNFQQQRTTPQDALVTLVDQTTVQPEPAPVRPNSVNQIIESITRESVEPQVTSVQPQRLVTEQKVVQDGLKGANRQQTIQFTGMIMRSTGIPTSTTVPAIFRQETIATSPVSSGQQEVETVTEAIGRLAETKYYQPTTTTTTTSTTTRQPTTLSESIPVRSNKQTTFNYGVKGSSRLVGAPYLPGPRRTLSRLDTVKDESQQERLQPARPSILEVPQQPRQTLPTITTRAPVSRVTQVEFTRAPLQQQQVSYSQTNQSSVGYDQSNKQPIIRQQQAPTTTTLGYQNVAPVANVLEGAKQQQWKGIKGGARNGITKQFWQSGNGYSASSANERPATTYLASSNRVQAPQINQSGRLMTTNYAAEGSSSGFGSRIVVGASS